MGILITGATGFLGHNLTKKLIRSGEDVHILLRHSSDSSELSTYLQPNQIHKTDGGFNSINTAVRMARPKVIFHLASKFISEHTHNDINSLIDSNITFPCMLLESMSQNAVHNLVNIGTAWQHYTNEEYDPVCLYAATKDGFESLIDYYVAANDINVVTLKLFDTYGPGDTRPKLMNLLRTAAVTGEIIEMSKGDQEIDLLHVDDVTDSFLRASEMLFSNDIDKHQIYKVNSGQPLILRDLARIIEEVTTLSLNIDWGKRPYRPREVMKTWRGGTPLPGWKPKISLTEGIKMIFLDHV